ncbi:hypothetical protein [Alistipes sp.]|uniref:hyaluronate lyase N-terminal domain-containing protein n=1 Tax=Alistipes sp. TaxID=1872444 RepID=UPI003AEFF3E2
MSRTINIHTRFQQRRGTAARWAQVNPVLREGEIGLELDTRRIKFGDGVTPWNDLEYSTQELLPASATALGGIVAREKGTDYTVEVLIDPKTNRLYVPQYPVVPELAPVASSGDYNDLDNTPVPYRLPAATETVIGGVAAAPKTADYTLEVKKDPTTHKLIVPQATNSSAAVEGNLPGLAIRVIYEHQANSSHFSNEPGEILNASIYFRPLCDMEYFNRIMPGLQVGLARCTSRNRQRRIIRENVSSRSTQWHIVGEPATIYSSNVRYPVIKEFRPDLDLFPFWTYEDAPPVAVSALIDEYYGQWIRFPYDLETVVRRFIYIYQRNESVSPVRYKVLPIHTLSSSAIVQGGYIKISGNHLKTNLETPRTKESQFYASVNLGFCFCRKMDLPANFKHWIFGPIERKRAMVVAKVTDAIFYYLNDPVKKKLVR